MRLLLIFSTFFLMSCALSTNVYQQSEFPIKPTIGYDRSIFINYLDVRNQSLLRSPLTTSLNNRIEWIPYSALFEENYPNFDFTLVAFNQLPNNSYTWQERILFADAADLIRMVVNHPLFLTEMQKEANKKPFYNNEQTRVIPAETVVNHIRSSKLKFFLGKDDLPNQVLAQATISGVNHVIWFRNDIDYQNDYSLYQVSEILLHEMTHNLGYLHSSNVPYGVQEPFLRVLAQLTEADANLFISVTPYSETDFLTRVRSQASFSTAIDNNIQQDFPKDFGNKFAK